MRPWTTVKREVLCRPNRFLSVELHAVELPDGRRIDDWPWLDTPDFVIILPRDAEGRFLLFRQTKYAIDGICLAPVGGYLEPGEDPQESARRELLEETGYRADRWASLGSYVVDANRGNGRGHFFLALEAERIRDPSSDDLEEQVLVRLERGELEAALDRGEFRALPWACAVALALRKLAAGWTGG